MQQWRQAGCPPAWLCPSPMAVSGIPGPPVSVVVTGLEKVYAVVAHQADQAMLLAQPPRPHA